MPKAKAAEAVKKVSDECILRMGKSNNVIEWREKMYTLATTEFGEVGTYFYTNVPFKYPYPHERDYNPYYVEIVPQPGVEPPAPAAVAAGQPQAAAVAVAEADDIDEEEADVAEVEEEEVGPALAPPPVLEDEIRNALISKLRGDAFVARRKREEASHTALRKLWGMTWSRMSAQSQSKVREEPGFERACLELNAIRLWTYIRRSHLTHIYGEDDEMSAANIHDQALRYNNLRQGDREYISDFKIRFDHQVKSNEGVGIPDVPDRLRAMDFIGKLDPKRYNGMLTSMRNCACQNLPGSYPRTLQAAYRTASTWTRDGSLVPLGSDSHSAFLADTAFIVTKGKYPKEDKDSKSTGDKKQKRSSLPSNGNGCYVCGKTGHVARDCSQRKSPDMALMVSALNPDEEYVEDIEYDIDARESAYLTAEETVLLSVDDVVFDNGSTVHLIKNARLLTDIGISDRPIVVNGVQSDATGVRVNMEGQLGDIGTVYYSKNASANILSMSSLVDAGADISYNREANAFTVRPRGSETTYSFVRRNVNGSESKFYVCNMGKMAKKVRFATTALVTTVASNMVNYTKREVIGANKARELLAKLGYPTVENAVAILRDGTGFDVTPYDFKVADAIWGPDIASRRGKTTRSKSMTPDITIGVPIVQQQQLLVVDIMFVDQVSTLVAVSYPLDLTFAVTLDRSLSGKASRAAEPVKKAMDIILSTLKSRNFVVSAIYSDGEGAIGKIKPQLNMMGIEVDISGAGGHVARIERRIRVIKERVRAHIAGRLPFALNSLGLSFLILFCVSRLNFQHTSTRPGGLTPREAFTGVRVAAEKDFRAAFGDSVIYTEPYSTSDMKSRVGQGIVYLPVGNRSGSIKILNLATGAIVTRDSFDIIPTTNATIKIMNDMAALDGRYMPKMSSAVHDLIYDQSVSHANMPTFTPVQPPLRDIGILALLPDEPHPQPSLPSQPLVLADVLEKPPPVIHDAIAHAEGGGK